MPAGVAVFGTLIRIFLKYIFRYPWGLLLSLIVDPIVLVLNIALLSAIYRHNQGRDVLGYSLNQMIWYFAVSSFIWYWTVNFAGERIARRVIDGDLAQDLLRPVSIFVWELGFAVALRVSGVVFEFIPALLVYSIFIPPEFLTAAALLRFVIAATMAFLLFYVINFLIGLISFYLQNLNSLMELRSVVVIVLAGALLPLDFFPDRVEQIMQILPFSNLFYWPIQFFLNRGAAGEWSTFLVREAVAAGWILLIFSLCWLLWQRAVRRYTDARG